MRPHGSPAQLEHRRIHALTLLDQGVPPVDVARTLGVDRRSVRRWHASVRSRGRDALRAVPASGRPPKLDGRAKRRLERHLLRGAQAAGFATDLWTCPRVATLIRREFGVRYHVDHIGRVLRALGWTPQKPERQARERDEAAIRRWVRVEWPRIKKKPVR